MQFTTRSTVKTVRRSLLAVGVSVAVHVALVAGVVGVSAWRMFSMAPPIRVQTIAIDLVKELPLGAPASREPPKPSEPPLPVRKPRHRVAAAKDGVTVVVGKDAGAPDSKPNVAPGPSFHAPRVVRSTAEVEMTLFISHGMTLGGGPR